MFNLMASKTPPELCLESGGSQGSNAAGRENEEHVAHFLQRLKTEIWSQIHY